MGAEYNRTQADAGAALCARLSGAVPLLLDGATGTELERRGVRCDLPLWSARALLEAPETLREIHADYVAAGVEALTANTFRTQRRALDHAGEGQRAAELTRLAVRLARGSARLAPPPRRVFVLGSAATLEDCYRPDLVPDAAALQREHAEHARNLVAAGVDAILIETMNTQREALAAARAARERGAPFFVSFICGPRARLISGEPLAEALDAVAPLSPLAVGVNCLPPSAVPPCLGVLRASGLPFSVYANLGAPGEHGSAPRSEECPPDAFAAVALGWVEAGAAAVGGCCGTRPDHLGALRRALDTRA